MLMCMGPIWSTLPVDQRRLAEEIEILAAEIDSLIARVDRLELQVGPAKPQDSPGTTTKIEYTT